MSQKDLDLFPLSWFRLYSEFSADPKVQSLSEAMQRRLIMLFCFHAKGELQKWTSKQISYAMRISEKEWQKTLKIFKECSFVDDELNIINWDKRQCRSDRSKDRVKAYRERLRNNDVTLHERYSDDTVTLQKRFSDVTVTGQSKRREEKKDINNHDQEIDLTTRSESFPPHHPNNRFLFRQKLVDLNPNFATKVDYGTKEQVMFASWETAGVILADLDAAIELAKKNGNSIYAPSFFKDSVLDLARDRITQGENFHGIYKKLFEEPKTRKKIPKPDMSHLSDIEFSEWMFKQKAEKEIKEKIENETN